MNRTAAEDGPFQVVAAGGVVVRCTAETQVAVIHRPKYDDWSFPKGKLEPGEEWLDAARREVEEETGFRCRPRRELSSTRYQDGRGRRKLVRYWLMEPLEGEFSPHEEVDELRWSTEAEAAELLSYAHDRELLREVLAPGG